MVWPTLISVSVAPVSYFFCASAGVANVTPSAKTSAAVDLITMPYLPEKRPRYFAAPSSVSLYQDKFSRQTRPPAFSGLAATSRGAPSRDRAATSRPAPAYILSGTAASVPIPASERRGRRDSSFAAPRARGWLQPHRRKRGIVLRRPRAAPRRDRQMACRQAARAGPAPGAPSRHRGQALRRCRPG